MLDLLIKDGVFPARLKIGLLIAAVGFFTLSEVLSFVFQH